MLTSQPASLTADILAHLTLRVQLPAHTQQQHLQQQHEHEHQDDAICAICWSDYSHGDTLKPHVPQDMHI